METENKLPENFNDEAPPLMGEPPKPKRAPRKAHAEVIDVSPEPTPTPQETPTQEPEKKEEPKPQTNVASAPKAPLPIDERGHAQAMDLEGAFRMASALFKGKGFPAWVKSAEQALAVSIFLKNLGLEVMTGIQHVCEVNGRLTLWGEGPLAAVRASGKLKSIKEGFYDKEYREICFKNKNLDAPIFFAHCVTTRADSGERKETWFSTIDEATAKKGLQAVWDGYRRTMYKRKARAENLKDNFGDILQGAGISEYDNEGAPDMPVEQPKSLAEKLAERAALEAPKEAEVGEALQN